MVAAVTIITPFFDLAIAVGVGCVIAMCGFTWETADRLTVEIIDHQDGDDDDDEQDDDDDDDDDEYGGGKSTKKKKKKKRVRKVYRVTGQLYYASIDPFLACFDVANDPPVVSYYDQRIALHLFPTISFHVLFHHSDSWHGNNMEIILTAMN